VNGTIVGADTDYIRYLANGNVTYLLSIKLSGLFYLSFSMLSAAKGVLLSLFLAKLLEMETVDGAIAASRRVWLLQLS